jgi:DNA-binding transcriptional MerR regulator
MKHYTVKKLAAAAGVSVRTLHYYDSIGLLKPESFSASRYRQYGEDSVVLLQQIMFFRELGFSLEDIRSIITQPDFDVLEALQSQRDLLLKKVERLQELMATIDRTIEKFKGDTPMGIKEYYQGFSDDRIEEYRQEVRRRWGEDALKESETRVMKMGKEKFAALQAEGGRIFQAISDNMLRGFDSPEVQELVGKWRQWLENFYHYSDEAVAGLGQVYSQDPEFAGFFRNIHPDLPEFLTRAVEYYCEHKK